MTYIKKRITIISITKPRNNDVNEDIQWMGDSLGLFHLRDKEKSCFRIFVEFIKAAKEDKLLSSDEIAERIGLTRGTAVHHLNKMMESGLVIQQKNRYILRDPNLEILLEDIKRDFEMAYEELKKTAKEIDKALGI
ncbi:MAG: helix-turn-helix domain-containing protein [Nanoarchaeota archaeon]